MIHVHVNCAVVIKPQLAYEKFAIILLLKMPKICLFDFFILITIYLVLRTASHFSPGMTSLSSKSTLKYHVEES